MCVPSTNGTSLSQGLIRLYVGTPTGLLGNQSSSCPASYLLQLGLCPAESFVERLDLQFCVMLLLLVLLLSLVQVVLHADCTLQPARDSSKLRLQLGDCALCWGLLLPCACRQTTDPCPLSMLASR